MFGLLEEVIQNQRQMLELPTRLEKDKLKEFSQLDRRWEIARLTDKVSVLSRGILALRTTLVGVVQVDPKKLLEEVLIVKFSIEIQSLSFRASEESLLKELLHFSTRSLSSTPNLKTELETSRPK